ncbi:hypothetical protein PMG11_10877 [Penicillium brasilianum]|uniref:Uncharacterized protein n=1 Tax=Penicillium brasilianum TaxID=104259 RepID=A0A0F7U2A1_PENBI|nr:hypothetical protein PMG11_10877 [Penicillium brasilianum]
MKALHTIGRLNLNFPVRSCSLPRILNKPTCIQSGGRRTHFSDGCVPFSPTGKVPWEGIHMSRANTHFKKPNLPWGFSIYRCTYKDDKAWERVLQLLQDSVQEDLRENAPELIPHHQLVINDDVTKFNGATSHEVRDHFDVWVEEQLSLVASSPEKLQDLGKPPEYTFGARFNYALFVDDICLESLEHMTSPVVKVLYKQWGNLTPEERNYEIHPDWHDGTTEMDEEDVGWMYMRTGYFVEVYDKCEWSHLDMWYYFYLRPPQIDGLPGRWGDRSKLPGFWRIKK